MFHCHFKLLNEFTALSTKTVALNFKSVRRVRQEVITEEHIRFYVKGIIYVIDSSRAQCVYERFNYYMLPYGHILYAHSKYQIRGDKFVFLFLFKHLYLFRHSNRWTKNYIMDLIP